MKILYDLSATQPVGGIKFHGGSEYSKILFRNLINYIEINYLFCYYNYQFGGLI